MLNKKWQQKLKFSLIHEKQPLFDKVVIKNKTGVQVYNLQANSHS